MIITIEKISVFIDGKLSKVFNTMLDALTYVHENCVGHKVSFKTETITEYVR